MRSAEEILREASTIAIVGASRYPAKVAHTVPRQILRHGWNVIPVNPAMSEIWGVPCYPTLADVSVPIDLVNVFRPSADAADIARQAVAVGAKAIWLQQDIRSDEARAIAEAAGLDYIEDQCIAVVRAVAAISPPTLNANTQPRVDPGVS
jgi:predicted CoA-binding protein